MTALAPLALVSVRESSSVAREHPYVRALHVIDMLLRLNESLHAENVLLRATIDTKFTALMEALQAGAQRPISPALVYETGGRRRNLSQSILNVIDREGRAKPSAMWKELCVTPANLSVALKRLRGAGLVVKIDGCYERPSATAVDVHSDQG